MSQNCLRCGGLIAEPNVAYGYAGKFCDCPSLGEKQAIPYQAPPEWAEVVPGYIAQLRNIVLWLSKQQWPQPQDQTWEGLLAAYDAEVNPEPLPELPARAYRVGK